MMRMAPTKLDGERRCVSSTSLRRPRDLGLARRRSPVMLGFFFWLCFAFDCPTVHAQIRPLLGPISLPAAVETADPLPIRRVFVPLERVSAELERAGAKKLIHLSQPEFEARLRAARVAQDATGERPRLVEARYKASLVGPALVGKAEWNLTHDSPLPGIFPVQPMNLALRQASLDAGPAILGYTEPRALGLLIEKRGLQHLAFDWSLRGEARPNGLRFDLRVPACVLTSLELDLPSGRSLSAPREQCLVTGPFPGSSAGRERWVLEILNRARIELIVRTPDRQDRGAPLLVARVEERQNLSLEQVECIHDFSIDVSRGATRELDLACTPGLQPVGVVWRNNDLEDWQLLPAAPGQQERRLHIRLPEALQNGQASLRIRAIAAGPLNQLWHSPELRLQNAVLLSDSLTIQIAPELELTDWHSGQFDLTKSLTDPSGCYVLQMQAVPFDAAPEAGAEVGRPHARPRLLSAQATARLQLWWDIGPSGERLVARARVEPRGGPLFRLQCRIPAGWRVERAELQPSGLLADWTVLESDKTSSLVVIHLNEAIESSQAVTVFLNLSRPPQSATGSEQTFMLPRIEFPLALSQECSLGVSVASQLRVKATPAPIYWQRPETNGSTSEGGQSGAGSEKPLWDRHPLWGLAYFHGFPPEGQLVVEGLVPRVKMRSTCRVDLAQDRPRVNLRLEVEPLAGAPQSFDVQFSAPIPASWHWIGVDGRPIAAQPVPCWESLGLPGLAGGPFERISVLASMVGRPHVWRFTFPEPLIERRIVEIVPVEEAPVPIWQIPLPVEVGDMAVVGDIELRSAGNERVTLETRGMTENPAQTPDADRPDISHLTYEGGSASLVIHEPRPLAKTAENARVDGVTLATFVESTGVLREQLAFRLHPAGAAVFPLQIPKGVQFVSLRIDGRWIAGAPISLDDDGPTLSVPTPVGAAWLTIEINWERVAPGWLVWNRVQATLPKFPGQTPICKRVWYLSPGLAPVNLQNLELLPGYVGGPNSWPIEAWIAARLTTNNDRTQVQHLIAEADVHIRGLSNETAGATLGARLQILVAELAKGQLGLVIDAPALQANGLSAGSLPMEVRQPTSVSSSRSKLALAATFLQPFGLELLATSPVPILTTQRAKLLMGTGEISPATEKAILQAVRSGRDASGRFENAAVWLADTTSEATAPTLLGDQARPFPGWPCWQVRGDGAEIESLLVVRQDFLSWTGYLLLVTLGVFGWRIRRQRRSLFALACAVFAGLLALSLVLPGHLFGALGGPCTGGLIICLAVLILEQAPLRSAATAIGHTPILLVAFGLLATLPGRAAAPADFTVLLLSEEGGKKIGVLAPLELLDSLNALVERSRQPLDRPVLLEAHYLATANEGSVDFDADFVIYSPNQGPADFLLPLGSAELRDARYDDQPAFPRAAPTGQSGFIFRIEGAGRHHLRLRFAVFANAQGADRDCRIAIPQVVLSRLDFRSPVGSQRLQAVQAGGAQEVTTNADGVRLLADLGRMPLLRLRWRVAVPKEEPAVLEVKELYVWDLQTARRLLGVLRYRVVRGSETELLIDVPADWEVRRVEAGLFTGSVTNWLRDWGIVPGPQGSRLRLEFHAPLTTSVQVFVELLSRKPATTHAALALPMPLGATSSGGILAYHLGLLGASLTESLGFTGVDLGTFVTQWQSAGVEDPGSLGRAFSFRRSGGAIPSMHLDLKPQKQLTASREFAWRVGPRGLACEAAFHVSGRDEEFTLVEWELPAGLQMEEVLGAEVRSWSITNRHVQVWLRPGVNKTTITWRAWTQNTLAAGEASAIPVVHLARAVENETSIRVEAEPGWTVSAGKLNNLRSLPAPGGSLSFATDQPQFSGEYILHETPPNRGAKIVEKPVVTDQRPAPKSRGVYLTLEEQAAFFGLDDGWQHRADYFFLAGAGQAVICPPGDAKFTLALLDGQELAPGDSACISLRFEAPSKRRHLRIYWRWPSQQEPADRPDLSKPRLENVAVLPGTQPDDGLWEIVAPAAMMVQASERATISVSPPTRFVRRAAAEYAVALFVAPAEKSLFRESEIQFRHNAEAASAWLAQAPALQEHPEDTADLEDRLRRLEAENHLLTQNAQSAEPRLSAESLSTRQAVDKIKGSSTENEPVARVSVGQGISSFWQATGSGGQPQVICTPAGSGSLRRWLGWCLAVALTGVLLFLVSSWTSEARRSTWRPEIAALLGALAGLLAGFWLLILIALGSGLIWRLVLVVLSASAKPATTESAPST